jgi:hypothetical protein
MGAIKELKYEVEEILERLELSVVKQGKKWTVTDYDEFTSPEFSDQTGLYLWVRDNEEALGK